MVDSIPVEWPVKLDAPRTFHAEKIIKKFSFSSQGSGCVKVSHSALAVENYFSPRGRPWVLSTGVGVDSLEVAEKCTSPFFRKRNNIGISTEENMFKMYDIDNFNKKIIKISQQFLVNNKETILPEEIGRAARRLENEIYRTETRENIMKYLIPKNSDSELSAVPIFRFAFGKKNCVNENIK
eukprot:Trichotokara_eunicae@DN94_c0_g1_i1.p1